MKTSEHILAKRYAAAYALGVGLAEGRNRLAMLEKCRALMAQDMRYHANPLVPLSLKLELADARLAKADCAPAAKFIKLLLSARRFALLDSVIAQAKELLDAAAGVRRAGVETALAESQQVKDKIAAALAGVAGGKVDCSFSANPALMGGVKIKMGDTVIDASISGRLARLKKTLMN